MTSEHQSGATAAAVGRAASGMEVLMYEGPGMMCRLDGDASVARRMRSFNHAAREAQAPPHKWLAKSFKLFEDGSLDISTRVATAGEDASCGAGIFSACKPDKVDGKKRGGLVMRKKSSKYHRGKDHETVILPLAKIMSDLRYEPKLKLHCILIIENGLLEQDSTSEDTPAQHPLLIGFNSNSEALGWKEEIDNVLLSLRHASEAQALAAAMREETLRKEREQATLDNLLGYLGIVTIAAPVVAPPPKETFAPLKKLKWKDAVETAPVSESAVLLAIPPRIWYFPQENCVGCGIPNSPVSQTDFVQFVARACRTIILPFIQNNEFSDHIDKAPRWFYERIVELSSLFSVSPPDQKIVCSFKGVVFWIEPRNEKESTRLRALQNYAKALAFSPLLNDEGCYTGKRFSQKNFDQCIPFSTYWESDDYSCLAVAPPNPQCILKRVVVSTDVPNFAYDAKKMKNVARLFEKHNSSIPGLGVSFALLAPQNSRSRLLVVRYRPLPKYLLHTAKLLGWASLIPPLVLSLREDDTQPLKQAIVFLKETNETKVIPLDRLTWKKEIEAILEKRLEECQNIPGNTLIHNSELSYFESEKAVVGVLHYPHFVSGLEEQSIRIEFDSENEISNIPVPPSKVQLVFIRRVVISHFSTKCLRPEMPGAATQNAIVPEIMASYFSALNERTTSEALRFARLASSMAVANALSDLSFNLFSSHATSRLSPRAAFVSPLLCKRYLVRFGFQLRVALHASGLNVAFLPLFGTACLSAMKDDENWEFLRLIFASEIIAGSKGKSTKIGPIDDNLIHSTLTPVLDGIWTSSPTMIAQAHHLPIASPDSSFFSSSPGASSSVSPMALMSRLRFKSVNVQNLCQFLRDPEVNHGSGLLEAPNTAPWSLGAGRKAMRINSMKLLAEAFCLQGRYEKPNDPMPLSSMDIEGTTSPSLVALSVSRILNPGTFRSAEARHMVIPGKEPPPSPQGGAALEKYGVFLSKLFIFGDTFYEKPNLDEIEVSNWWGKCKRGVMTWLRLALVELAKSLFSSDQVQYLIIACDATDRSLGLMLEAAMNWSSAHEASPYLGPQRHSESPNIIATLAVQLNSLSPEARHETMSAAALGSASVRSEVALIIVSIRVFLSLKLGEDPQLTLGEVSRLIKCIRRIFYQLCVDKSTSPRELISFAADCLMLTRRCLLWLFSFYRESERTDPLCLETITSMIQINDTDLSDIGVVSICAKCLDRTLSDWILSKGIVFDASTSCRICSSFPEGPVSGFVQRLMKNFSRQSASRIDLPLTMLSESAFANPFDLKETSFHVTINTKQGVHLPLEDTTTITTMPLQGVYTWGDIAGLSLEDEQKIRLASANNVSFKEKKRTDNAGRIDLKRISSLDSNIKVKCIACSHRHTVLITDGGLVLTFGFGGGGRLGHGNDESIDSPKIVDSLLRAGVRASQASCGREHTVVIGDMQLPSSNPSENNVVLRRGLVFSWGWGEAGRLGVGDVGIQSTPVLVEVLAFSSRDSNFGEWGQSDSSTTGESLPAANGTGGGAKQIRSQKSGVSPVLKSDGHIEIQQVSCGREHTLCLDKNGKVFVFGAAGNGRLGQENEYEDCLYPSPLAGEHVNDQVIVSIAAGDAHSLAACADGTVLSWGFGGSGALGHGDENNQPLPRPIMSLLENDVHIVSVSSGSYHCAALDSNGGIWTWGDGVFGQLGYVTISDNNQSTLLIQGSNIPRQVNASEMVTELGTPFPASAAAEPGSTGPGRVVFKQVVCGETITLAHSSSGFLFEWGFTEPEAPDGGAGLKKHKFPRYPERLIPTLIKMPYSSRVRSVAAGGCHIIVFVTEPDAEASPRKPVVEVNIPNLEQEPETDILRKPIANISRTFICGGSFYPSKSKALLSESKIGLDQDRKEELRLMSIWRCNCGDCGQSFPALSNDFAIDSSAALVPKPLLCLDGKDIVNGCFTQTGDEELESLHVLSLGGTLYTVSKDLHSVSVVLPSDLINVLDTTASSVTGFSSLVVSYMNLLPSKQDLLESDFTQNNSILRSVLNWSPASNFTTIPFLKGNSSASPVLYWTPTSENQSEDTGRAIGMSMGMCRQLISTSDGKLFQHEFDESFGNDDSAISAKRVEALLALEAVSTPSRRTAIQSVRNSLGSTPRSRGNSDAQRLPVHPRRFVEVSKSFLEMETDRLGALATSKKRRESASNFTEQKSSELASKSLSTIDGDDNTDTEEGDVEEAPPSAPNSSEATTTRTPNKRFSAGKTSTASSTSSTALADEPTAATKEQNRRSNRLSSQVLSIYQVHSPDKLEQRGFLRLLLKHYRGREESLVSLLAQKFAPEHQQRTWLPPLPYDLGPSVRVAQIACGRKHSLILSQEGIVLSLNGEAHPVPFPEQGTKITDIACGDLHSLALSSNGIVYSWGNNTFGQLGLGSRSIASSPTKIVHGNILASKIACGATHSIIVGQDPTTCYAFGNGHHGRLGVGDTTDKLVPTPVLFPYKVKVERVIAGTKRTIFVTKEA